MVQVRSARVQVAGRNQGMGQRGGAIGFVSKKTAERTKEQIEVVFLSTSRLLIFFLSPPHRNTSRADTPVRRSLVVSPLTTLARPSVPLLVPDPTVPHYRYSLYGT